MADGQTGAPGSRREEQAWPSPFRRWYAVIVLTLGYILSFADRQILTLTEGSYSTEEMLALDGWYGMSRHDNGRWNLLQYLEDGRVRISETYSPAGELIHLSRAYQGRSSTLVLGADGSVQRFATFRDQLAHGGWTVIGEDGESVWIYEDGERIRQISVAEPP